MTPLSKDAHVSTFFSYRYERRDSESDDELQTTGHSINTMSVTAQATGDALSHNSEFGRIRVWVCLWASDPHSAAGALHVTRLTEKDTVRPDK
jgi:hypothetical protein